LNPAFNREDTVSRMDEVLDGLKQTDKEKKTEKKNLVKYKYNKKFSVS